MSVDGKALFARLALSINIAFGSRWWSLGNDSTATNFLADGWVTSPRRRLDTATVIATAIHILRLLIEVVGSNDGLSAYLFFSLET